MQMPQPAGGGPVGVSLAPNPWDGAVQVMRMGVAGRNFLKNAVYSAHFGTEGLTPAEAKLKLASVRAIASKYGAEVANSIPAYFNANPFMEITPILGPNGELWKPTHGVLPFSAVLKHHAEFEALLAEYRDRMRQHRVQLTRMLMFFSTNAFIYEPTFLWEDERSIYHRRVYPAALLPNVPEHPANPQGRALVSDVLGLRSGYDRVVTAADRATQSVLAAPASIADDQPTHRCRRRPSENHIASARRRTAGSRRTRGASRRRRVRSGRP